MHFFQILLITTENTLKLEIQNCLFIGFKVVSGVDRIPPNVTYEFLALALPHDIFSDVFGVPKRQPIKSDSLYSTIYL